MQPATATRNHRAAEPTKHRAYQDHARYNHANQRVFVRNGNTVTYYLYGLGGERLMEFQETCTSGACTSYTETQRWIHFAGRKMFSKTGTTLKAITPDRLASEAKHFPYGETDGTPPSDTKDYFATYRRDGTGLDYAWNRYYSPTMGRFTTADPDGGSINPQDPQSWNRYTYTRNNPVNAVDATGYSDFLLGRFGTCDLFDPAEIEFTGSLISETGMAGCPPWSRPDPSYRQQRFVPGNIDVTAIGADGMYYIMHNTQAGTIPVFTVETVLVVGGRVLVTVVGKVALPITIAAVGAGLVYYYWDDIIEGIEGARDEIIRDIVRSGCPPSENFNNPEIQPRPGFDKVYNTDGSITWLNRATGEYLRPDLTHGPPIGPHWDFRIMFPNGFYEIWRCFKDKAPEFKERGRRWWDSIIQ